MLDELGVTVLGATAFDPDALHPSDVVVAATGGRQRPGYPLETDASMRVDATNFAIGDCALPVHARFGRIASPHWTPAVATALVAARTILGEHVVYDELPYWWSDIGPRRIDEVGHAPAAATWDTEDGLLVGRDAGGDPACVTLLDQPRRLRDARRLLT